MVDSVRTAVAHLSSVHRPDDPRILRKECATLAAAGYEVTLVARKGDDFEPPHGVEHVAVVPSRGRARRMLLTTWRVYREASRSGAEICHFHDPELIPVGLLLKLQGRIVIYDAHEDYRECLKQRQWLPRAIRAWVASLVGWLEATVVPRLDLVVAATPPIAERFSGAKTVLVQNFPDLREFPVPNSSQRSGHLFAYTGTIDDDRGASTMVQALDLLPSSSPIRLCLAGLFDDEATAREFSARSGWRRVEYLGWQSRSQVARLLTDATAGLAVYHPVPNLRSAQAVKLFEYMAAGIPVIASDFPAWRRFVSKPMSGLTVDPAAPSEVAEAMLYLDSHPDEAREMGMRGRHAVEHQFNWGPEGRRLVNAYASILSGRENA